MAAGLQNSEVASTRLDRQVAAEFDRLAWSQWRAGRSAGLRKVIEAFINAPEKMAEVIELASYKRPPRLAKSIRYRVITGWTGMLDGGELTLSRGAIVGRECECWLPERLFALGVALQPVD